MSWAKRFFQPEIQRYSSFVPSYSNQENCPIWTCWWQGEDAAPKNVKLCWASIKRHKGNHPLVILTKENYAEHCHIPRFIQNKFEKGLISNQLMSDYLRVNLLNQKGGLWVDATIFACRNIPESVFSLPIYNVKDIDDSYPMARRVADAEKWQIYFIAAQKGSLTYAFIAECLTKYWNKYDSAIDYYLTYYLAKLAREELTTARKEYDQVPCNNRFVELMDSELLNCDKHKNTIVPGFLNSSTFVYKLSWRETYPEKNSYGQESFAHQFLTGKLDQPR